MRVQREKGFVVLSAILILLMLAGFMGLISDTANLQGARLRVQTAADAGAIAALYHFQSGTVAMQAAAAGDAARNGIREAEGARVAVNCPPRSGAYSNDPSAVEVTIEYKSPVLFMRVFGQDTAGISGRAVAIAGEGGRPTLGE